ncbi:MAG: type II CAAX endopeptidase family protein [Pseudomonadota bacterium]
MTLALGFLILCAGVSADVGSGSAERNLTAIHDRLLRDFDQTLAAYVARTEIQPSDPVAQVERCRFLESVFYSDGLAVYERPVGEYLDKCVLALEHIADEYPDARVFLLHQRYGDDYVASFRSFEKEGVFVDWPEDLQAEVYASAAIQSARGDEQSFELGAALYALDLAQNEELRLTLVEHYIEAGQHREAAKHLDLFPDTLEQTWLWGRLTQAHLDLGRFEHAEDLLDNWPEDQWSPNTMLVTKIAVGLGKTGEAIEQMNQHFADEPWNATEQARELFEFSLQLNDTAAARTAYGHLLDQGLKQDAFWHYKFQLLLLDPSSGFGGRELLALGIGLLVSLATVLATALLLMPVHYRGLLLQRQGAMPVHDVPHWSLWHAWYVLATMLISSLLAMAVFAHDELWWALFSSESSPVGTTSPEAWTKAMVLTLSLQLVFLAPLMLRRLAYFGSPKMTLLGGLGIAVGFYVILRIVTLAHVSLWPDIGNFSLQSTSIINDVIVYLLQAHGIWASIAVIGLLIPIVEEWVFRGVLLDAISRHIGFGWANSVQAILFALAHDDYRLFGFYFLFGLLAGYCTKRAGGLFPAILLHVINNSMVVLAFAFLANR